MHGVDPQTTQTESIWGLEIYDSLNTGLANFSVTQSHHSSQLDAAEHKFVRKCMLRHRVNPESVAV